MSTNVVVTAKDLYELGVKYRACEEGLASINGQSAAQWWDTCVNYEWMLWLEGKAWNWQDGQLAAFEAKVAPIYADYRAKLADVLREVVGNPFPRATVAA
ncbi:MAG: hypothetical protein WBQ94_03630 [Terracidiphilus sp.]